MEKWDWISFLDFQISCVDRDKITTDERSKQQQREQKAESDKDLLSPFRFDSLRTLLLHRLTFCEVVEGSLFNLLKGSFWSLLD